VDLRVNLQLSNTVAGQTLFGGAIVDRRETTTQLIVGDGQTVVISGIMRTEDTETKRKIPLLGDIPILGLPFNSTERSKTNTELVAFITPVVVNNREESDRLNDPLRRRLNDLRDHLQDKSGTRGSTPTGEPAAAPATGELER
jgi:type II secretory pathway component GspD/PulD (secretin)